MSEYTATVTDDDLRFLERTVEHYRLFAESAERQGEKRTAGIMRKQEFYGERMLKRIQDSADD